MTEVCDFDVWISKQYCFRITRKIVQYQKDLRSQIILCKILLNFMYEAVVEPVDEYSAVKLSLFLCTPKDWKVIFIFAC